MTCAEFDASVVEIARGADASEEALAHAARCEACAEALAGQQQIARNLKVLAADLRTGRPSAGVEQRLLSAFREKAATGKTAATATAVSQQGRGYWLRTAAAILAIFGFGAWFLLSSGAPTRGRIATGATAHDSPGPAEARGADEFIPVLGYGSVSATDSGVVVRVLLPEDAFQYFALPVARMPGGLRFPADVLIADDGSVRAIRLVAATDGRP